jgi:hypothetical protein
MNRNPEIWSLGCLITAKLENSEKSIQASHAFIVPRGFSRDTRSKNFAGQDVEEIGSLSKGILKPTR